MTKSGYLPDISGTFAKWRQEYREGMDGGKWAKASLALHNMNGSLDDDYVLPISDEKWSDQHDGYVVWECTQCMTERKIKHTDDDGEVTYETVTEPTRSKKDEIKIFEEKCSDVIRLLSNLKTRRMWGCPKCGNIAPVRSVSSKLLKYPAPHYRSCIYTEPQPPKTGLMMRRGNYPTLMRKWTRLFSFELEHQLAVYRLEYIKRNGVDMEDSGYQDKGDT